MRTPFAPFAALFGALALAGCSDPFVGEWEHEDSSDVDLEIVASEDGYEGEGHLVVCWGEDCYLCPFEFEASDEGDGRLEVEGRFVDGCSDAGAFDGVECELVGDDKLECELPDGGGTLDYERVGD